MKKRRYLKKGLAILLTAAMVAGLVPTMSGGAVEVQAATENGTGSTPSVTAYATKTQLMNAFTPGEDGTAANYGKLVFGQDENGNAQEWYILGKDTGVSGDNTIIFAASPIATNQVFNSSTSDKTYSYGVGTGYGESAGSIEVYANHYGASDLRGELQSMAANETYFTTAEQGLMNATTVKTKDTKNSSVTYTTTDKLYALQGDYDNNKYLWAGTSDSTVLAMNSYWNSGDYFWLRSPYDRSSVSALPAFPGYYVPYDSVVDGCAVQPASNLNLSSVLFASAATAASSDTVSNTIASETAMTLRFDGTGKNIGAAIYNVEAGTIDVRRGSTSQTVALVVQGNDGTSDWYYSKKIDASETINVSAIVSETNTPASIDLSNCKIWLEITDTDGLIYAVGAEKEIEQINTTYVTKEQLMNSFKPYSAGTASNIAKLVFGQDENGNAQEWYILGKDTDVSGDNTIIFAASPIATNQMFEDDLHNNKTDTSLWSDCDYNGRSITEVYPNHYGASDLRVVLKRMATDENYFTEAEQGLMNDTTVTTNDKMNSVNYTTTDKLYALAADDTQTIKAGTFDRTVLAMSSSYWSGGPYFWLRSPHVDGSNYEGYANYAKPSHTVGDSFVYAKYAVQPASNLNLSSVLFASGAQTASSGAVLAGTITSGTAMTLRLDGTNTAIGTVIYDATNGKIAAQKDSDATGTVSLVVQGNDWYYSVPVGGTIVVTAEHIKNKLSLSEAPDLADCKIWLETTIDNVAYARTAVAVETMTVETVNSVAVTDVEPVGGEALNTEASCNTTGIATTAITYTTTGDSGDEKVTGIADWNTTYKTNVTLGTGIVNDVVYVFDDSISVTVDGEAQSDSLAPNVDGTVTVTKEFTTAKRKIVSVAPEVPTDNTFITYYGYEGYNEVLSDVGNSELGKQAMVTLEGTELVASTTEAMDVTWKIANADDTEYDRTPGATNTFRWTIPASEFANYDAADCVNYVDATDTITGTVEIKNKAATPVTITGTDSSVAYTGETIDVSQYFTIDSHAGTATYSLVTGAGGGTGVGSLDGSTLTVTKTGTFKIKVNTAANGIYGAGEKLITLTVDKGTIEYTATDYSTTYDGQGHSISVNVTKPEGTTVTYSTDGENYGSDNPSFMDEGTYTVYYRITKDNYDTVEASKTVTINKKSATITAENQDIVWGNDVDRSKYTVSEGGLLSGDSITEITLTPSTTALTENGTISISGVKIENSTGVDVTGNYDITSINGTLKIVHNITLAPDRIETVKTKTTYTEGDTLNVDDITVTAHYADGYSRKVTGFTTNVTTIDMSKAGDKTLTVSYTENGKTKTKDIIVKVKAATPQPPKKGAVVADDKGTGDYKVTDAAKKAVTYQTPANKKLATISVPSTVKIGGVTYKVTSIANNAFANNKKITKVTIGSNVTTIGKKAFYECTSLTKITIPSKVKKIGKQAFYGCKKLKTITIKTTKLTGKNVGSKAFKGIHAKATIKVPKSKLKSYKKLLRARGVGKKAKIKK